MTQTLRFKIKKQAKLEYLLPFIPLGVVFILALIFSLFRKPLGMSESTTSVFVAIGFIASIAFLIWYNISPQGEIHLEEHEMAIFPFLRKSVKIPVHNISEMSIKEWWIRSKVMPGEFVGPVIFLKSGNRGITIGCFDRSWKPRKHGTNNRVTTCQFVVSKDDFEQILEYLKAKESKDFS